eukprot:5495062-Pyramimonas_sp.AAC.1
MVMMMMMMLMMMMMMMMMNNTRLRSNALRITRVGRSSTHVGLTFAKRQINIAKHLRPISGSAAPHFATHVAPHLSSDRAPFLCVRAYPTAPHLTGYTG